MNMLKSRLAAVLVLGLTATVFAGADETAHTSTLVLIEPLPSQTSILYTDGSEVELELQKETRFFCGSDTTHMTIDDLRSINAEAEQLRRSGAPTQIVTGNVTRGSGLNIVWNVSGSPPAEFNDALARASTYFSGLFADPITITINISWAALPSGILGSTGSSTTYVNYSIARPGLVNDMDADDTIQTYLPIGTTYPVMYNANTGTITNETRVRFTVANYNAAIGSLATTAASMTISSNLNWDFDESNGTGFRFGFESVLAHEVGHALGFTSNADLSSTSDSRTMDLFRFQRTDGGTDRNPDSLTEFQVQARLVDYNNPDDDANSDLVAVSYRMSDGDPWQASHFREQAPNIGIMDPALGQGQSFYPDFLKTSDRQVFDAMGWDYVVSTCTTPGDMDNDGDVDLEDVKQFQLCVDLDNPTAIGCECADVFVEDDRVTELDWFVIEDLLLTGP